MSKYDQYKSKSIVFPHKHCPKCSKMVPEEEGEFGEYCSAECAGFFKTQKKNKKKKTFLFIGLYGVAIIIFVVLAILGQN